VIIPLVSSTGHGHASIKRLHHARGAFAVGTILAVVFPKDEAKNSSKFLYEYLMTYKEELLVSKMTGTANITLTVNSISNVLVPDVPIEVQELISNACERVDELVLSMTSVGLSAVEYLQSCIEEINIAEKGARLSRVRDLLEFFLENLERFSSLEDLYRCVDSLREIVLTMAFAGDLDTNEPSESSLDINNSMPDSELPENWVIATLGDIASWGSGSTPSRSNPSFYKGTNTWFKSGELSDTTFLVGSEEKISDEAIQFGSFRRNSAGDILLAMYGATIGKVAILGENAVTNQAVCGCTPIPQINTRYLFWFLRSNRKNFMTSAEGGAQPNISKIKIQKTLIPLAPVDEQIRIANLVDEVFGRLDEIVEAIEEVSLIRKDLIQAIFPSMSLSSN
jgi:restriction endonuclease S subunit